MRGRAPGRSRRAPAAAAGERRYDDGGAEEEGAPAAVHAPSLAPVRDQDSRRGRPGVVHRTGLGRCSAAGQLNAFVTAVGDGPAPTTGLAVRPEGDRRRFPRSPVTVRRGRCPTLVPAASPRLRPRVHRGLPTHELGRLRSRPTRRACTARPAQIRQVRAGTPLSGRCNAGSSRTPSRLACRTRVVWQYRHVPALSGLLPPDSASPQPDCPQLHQAAATARPRRCSTSTRSHSASWRTSSFGYLLGAGTAPPSRGFSASIKPGAVHLASPRTSDPDPRLAR